MTLEIKQKIDYLRKLIFANSQYLYKIENYQYLPLKEKEVLAFEERHRITLPEGYRDFLLQIGNGGLGPGTGVLPLKVNSTYPELHMPWVDPDEFNSIFKHNSQEEDFDAFTDRVDKILDEEDTEASLLYDASENGLLCVGNGGCGTYYGLIVCGKNKGQIWINLTVDDEGFLFKANNFLEWYEAWLNKKIQQVEEKNVAIERILSQYSKHSFLLQNLEELTSLIHEFKDVKDKQPIKKVFRDLLKGDVLPYKTLTKCIDYTLNQSEHADYEIALKFIKKGASNFKERPLKEWLSLKGKALVGLGNFKQALISFEKAMECGNEPKLDYEFTRLLAYCLLKLNQPKRALQTITPQDDIPDVHNAIALLDELYNLYKDYETVVALGQLILSWKLFKKEKENQKYLPFIHLMLIYTYAKLDDGEQIYILIEKLVQIKKEEEAVPYENIALELINAKHYAIALNCLEKYASFARAKENPQGLYNLKGCCYAGLKSYQKAIECFNKSFEVHHWIVPYANLIRCYIHLEKYDMAQKIFDELVVFDPYYSWSYYQFSLFYVKKHMSKKAIDLLNQAVSLGFDKNEILNDLELDVILEDFKKGID